MQNFSCLPKSRQYLMCKLPQCNCQKCTKLRSENRPDQSIDWRSKLVCDCKRNLNLKEIKELPKCCDTAKTDDNPSLNKIPDTSKPSALRKLFTIPNLKLPICSFTPLKFESILADIVGVVSFFIMASLMFWFTVSKYLWCLGRIILQSGRRVQILALVLMLLLFASVTYHAIRCTHWNRESTPSTIKETCGSWHVHGIARPKSSTKHVQTTCQQKKCCPRLNSENHKKCDTKSTPLTGNLDKKQNSTLCELCEKKFKGVSDYPTSLNDNEIREMYHRYRLYSAPSDMKFPPSFANIIEVLAGIYNGISGSLANTFS